MLHVFSQWNAQLDANGVPIRYDRGHDEAKAVADGLAVVFEGQGDGLRVAGKDALDLLHRLAASEVRGIPPHQWRPLLLTSDKGKVIDHAQLLHLDDELHVLCGNQRLDAVRDWIDRFVITEDVALRPQTDATHWWLVGAPVARLAAERMNVEPLDGPYAARHDAAGNLLLTSGPQWTGLFRLSVPRNEIERVIVALVGHGAVLVGRDAFDAWRIPHGRVLSGADLASGVNPLEVGLRGSVSFTKGCYVGQEVVARLDTYEKVRRAVAVLDVPGGAKAGDEVVVDGRRAGTVLASAAETALALVPRHLEAGDRLEVASRPGGVRSVTPA